MQDRIIEIFKIPGKARVNKRIPKTLFYKNAELNKAETKTFVDEIQSVQLLAMLNSDSIRVAPFVNEDFNISDVALMMVELKNRGKEEKVASIVHASIPYPLLIVLVHRNEIRFSTALKRLNKNDSSAVVMEDTKYSPWIDLLFPLPVQKTFLNSLALDTLPFDNLFRLYLALDNRVYLTELIKLIDIYPSPEVNVREVQEMLDQIEELEKIMKNLQATMKREKSFARQMEQHVQIQQVQQQLEALITQLREVC
jgi:hypothetical protein